MDYGRLQLGRLALFGAADAECIYVMGGHHFRADRSLNEVVVFETRMQKFRSGPPLNYPRNEGASVFLDGSFYVVGGMNEHRLACKMERLQVGGACWETDLTDGLVDERFFHALVKIPIAASL